MKIKSFFVNVFCLFLLFFSFSLHSFQYIDSPTIYSEEFDVDDVKAPYKWDFAIVSIFQDEAPYLKEWIEFHRLMGAQHFYLYNNLSHDDYLSVLQPYIDSGIVELFDWPYDNNGPSEFNAIAINAFRDGHRRAIGNVKWLAILDTDEFLYVVKGTKIQDYLQPLIKTKCKGVHVYWYMFGTSHVPQIPQDKLMIETLTYSGGKHSLYKTICRPECVVEVGNQHICIYLPKCFAHTDIASVLGDIRINHYWAKDEDYFYNIKIPRREKYGTPKEVSEQWNDMMNSFQDLTIQPFVDPLRKALGFN